MCKYLKSALQDLHPHDQFPFIFQYKQNIVAAFRGMHVSRHLRNIAKCDYQESVTTGLTHGQTDRQTPDKVIPMCCYASQATQKVYFHL